MPEQISKYPEVTLKVLQSAGARCGEGAKQNILTACPAERFCALRGGEICVYGIKDIPRMTQITTQELARVVCPPAAQTSAASLLPALGDPLLLGALFAAGVLAGRYWPKTRRR